MFVLLLVVLFIFIGSIFIVDTSYPQRDQFILLQSSMLTQKCQL